MHGIDVARERLRKLAVEQVATPPNDPNEATTRLRVIDVLLTEVLGWSKANITAEEHQNGQYLDYVLSDPARLAVVEAKRVGVHFELPAGFTHGELELKTLRNLSGATAAAIDQVSGYCQRSGTAVAVLCNGRQILAFLGARSDGVPPGEGRAIAYASTEEALEQVEELWNLLSPEGLRRGSLKTRLMPRGGRAPAPPALKASIPGYPGHRQGSAMETDLDILGDLFVQDLPLEESVSDEFLRECYCRSGALSQYAMVSKEILRTRYAAVQSVASVAPATGKRGTAPELSESVVAGALTRRPVVLLGNVGVGKSMFLRHLLRVEAAEFSANMVVFYLDFLDHSGHDNDIDAYIFRHVHDGLINQLNVDISSDEHVRRVYKEELRRFGDGVNSRLKEADPAEFVRKEVGFLSDLVADELEHLKRSLEFLQRQRRLTFVLALDNVDQHEPRFQERVFVAGQSFAKTWPCTVFLSLRPETYYRSKADGVMQAYQPRVFSVAPARVDEVVLKRLRYGRRKLVETGRLDHFPKGLTIDSDNLVAYMDTLIQAFETNDDLNRFVDNLSAGNTRSALGYISSFIGTGYVQTRRIIEIREQGSIYTIPMHEFQRAVIYGEHEYYDPSQSPIQNLYHIDAPNPAEHFITGIALALIESLADSSGSGFASGARIFEALQALGYEPEAVSATLDRCVTSRLAECPTEGRYSGYYRIATSGAYLWKVLGSEFAYLDAVVVDTPITDPEIRAAITNVHAIEARLKRGELFVTYLDQCWPFDGRGLPYDWPVLSARAREKINQARLGAQRAGRNAK